MNPVDQGLAAILEANSMKGIRIGKTLLIDSQSWRFSQIQPHEPKAYNPEGTLVVCVEGQKKANPETWKDLDKRYFDGYTEQICVSFPDTFPRQHQKAGGPLTVTFDIKYVKNIGAALKNLKDGTYRELCIIQPNF